MRMFRPALLIQAINCIQKTNCKVVANEASSLAHVKRDRGLVVALLVVIVVVTVVMVVVAVINSRRRRRRQSGRGRRRLKSSSSWKRRL